jgi:hypothetical protein
MNSDPAMEYAKRLALIAPEALGAAKLAVNRGLDAVGFNNALNAGLDLLGRALCGNDRSRQRVRRD